MTTLLDQATIERVQQEHDLRAAEEEVIAGCFQATRRPCGVWI